MAKKKGRGKKRVSFKVKSTPSQSKPVKPLEDMLDEDPIDIDFIKQWVEPDDKKAGLILQVLKLLSCFKCKTCFY